MSNAPTSGVWLLAAAAPREAEAVLRAFGAQAQSVDPWACVQLSDRFHLVQTGVGKANASGGVARAVDPDRHTGVISVGIAGALPMGGLKIGDAICATSSVFSDEGVGTPSGFVPCSDLGFGYFEDGSMRIEHPKEVVDWLSPYCDHQSAIACVSWCSGEDGCAAGVVDRTGAHAEAMEGAACALVAQRLGLLTGELRVISNTTGNRDAQVWDLDGALDRLQKVLGRIAGC